MDVIGSYVTGLINATFQPTSSGNNIYAEYAKDIQIQTYGRFANYGGLYETANVFANYSTGRLNYSCNSYFSQPREGVTYSSQTSCNNVGIYKTVKNKGSDDENKKDKDVIKCEGFGCGNMTINTTNGLAKDYIIDYNGCGVCESMKECFKQEYIKWNISCYDKEKKKMVYGVFDGEKCDGNEICCGGLKEDEIFKNIQGECLDLSLVKILNARARVDVMNMDKIGRGIIGKWKPSGMSLWMRGFVFLIAFGAIGLFFMMLGVIAGSEILRGQRMKLMEKYADK